jgi:hypothetical protein
MTASVHCETKFLVRFGMSFFTIAIIRILSTETTNFIRLTILHVPFKRCSLRVTASTTVELKEVAHVSVHFGSPIKNQRSRREVLTDASHREKHLQVATALS